MIKPVRLEDIPFSETLGKEPEAPRFGDVAAARADLRSTARLYWFRHTFDGCLNNAFHACLKHCPPGFVSRFGQSLVPLSRWVYRHKIFSQRIARNFSALTDGRWTNDGQRQVGLKRWWINIGRTISEFCIVNKLWKNSRIQVEGLENLEATRSHGGPLIFTSVHLSTWEAVFAAIHEGLSGPSIGPFQPEPNRFKNKIVHAIRKERNQYLFPPGQRSAYRLHRLMGSGLFSMTIFIDEVRENQIHLPFFGRKPPEKGNAVVATKIANSCGGTIVPVYLTRLGPARFKLVILPPVERIGTGEAYDIRSTVQALNDIFEPIVLENIEEWYMLGELRLPKSFERTPFAQELAKGNAERHKTSRLT
ncbi:lysophospholipid acyltransferase family protein [uncultured Roseibium sp.]|uniref:lysophospholipid acyltransferase family protein n=1 Tax=uncultured Roseibium sp. TaxID=1936171 RepID=UPI002636B60D|nr:lysophospholipid acyltransferase family protein [uncultured Roseibium sp.]